MTTLERPQPKLSMADKAARIDAICKEARILPVITIAREEDILPLADALAAGGIRTLEVTLRSQYGLKAIQVLREQCRSFVSVPAPCSIVACSPRLKLRVRNSSLRQALPKTFSKLVWTARSRCCQASARRPKS